MQGTMSAKLSNLGLGGYGSNRLAYKHRPLPARRRRKGRRFAQRVQKSIENIVLEKANRTIVQSGRISAGQNQQGYETILLQNSRSDLQNIYQQIQLQFAVPSVGQLKSQRFTVTSYNASIWLKNQSNTSVVIDLYVLRPRTDVYASIGTMFEQSFIDQNSTGASAVPGTTLYMANQVTAFCKILRKQRYILTGGATEFVEYKDRRNYNLEYERINQTVGATGAIALQYLRGFTTVFFAIIRGEPMNDMTNVTNVQSAPVAVDWITQEVYWYTFTIQNQVVSSTSVSAPTITTPVTVNVQTAATQTPDVS